MGSHTRMASTAFLLPTAAVAYHGHVSAITETSLIGNGSEGLTGVTQVGGLGDSALPGPRGEV